METAHGKQLGSLVGEVLQPLDLGMVLVLKADQLNKVSMICSEQPICY